MNLGLLRCIDGGYDAVILLNSDTVVPRNLIPGAPSYRRPHDLLHHRLVDHT